MGYQLPISPNSITIAGHLVPLGGSQNIAASDLTNGTTGSGAVALASKPSITITAAGSTHANQLATRFSWGPHPEDFGAVGDGITDDTAALQAAISAAAPGGVLELSSGKSYLVSGTGTQCLLITQPIYIRGAPGSFIVISGTTGVSTDIFRIAPTSIAEVGPGYIFEKFAVRPAARASGLAGRHVFEIDLSASANLQLEGLIIRDIIEPFETIGLDGFVTGGSFVHATTALHENIGQLFRAIIENNHIYHGIDLSASISDSPRIINNTIIAGSPGSLQAGIKIGLVVGAGDAQVIGNSITTNAGCIIVSSGYNINITGNELEQTYTNNEVNNSMIDITGGALVDSTWIHHNQIQSVVTQTTLFLTSVAGILGGASVSGAGIPDGALVGLVSSDGNWIQLSGSYPVLSACLITEEVVSGATIVINSTDYMVANNAFPQAVAIVNNGNGTVIGPNRYGSLLGSPLIQNSGGGLVTLPGEYPTGNQLYLRDNGDDTINLVDGLIDEWVSPAFDAGSFTANGSMTWTVIAGNVTTYAYKIVGKTMTVAFSITGTSVGGTPDTQLRIAIPAGASVLSGIEVVTPIIVNDNGTWKTGQAAVGSLGSSTIIALFTDFAASFWTASSGATQVFGEITFPIS